MIIVGGDSERRNRRALSDLIEDYDDIEVNDCPPTRLGAHLDETAFLPYIDGCNIYPPLRSNLGTNSDHNVIIIKTKIPKINHFKKVKFKHRPITTDCTEKFISMITLTDWKHMQLDTPSQSALAMTLLLDEAMKTCFPEVEVSYKSTGHPWIRRKHRRQARRRRRRIYAREGKSERWEKEKEEFLKELEVSKLEYFEKLKAKAKAAGR